MKAFLEAAILTSVAVEPDDQTLAVSQTPVLDLLLNTSPEETLHRNKEETLNQQILDHSYSNSFRRF